MSYNNNAIADKYNVENLYQIHVLKDLLRKKYPAELAMLKAKGDLRNFLDDIYQTVDMAHSEHNIILNFIAESHLTKFKKELSKAMGFNANDL